jgi:hypothetical protein
VEGQQQQLQSKHAGCEVLVQVVVRLRQQAGQEVEAHLQEGTAAADAVASDSFFVHNACSIIRHSITASSWTPAPTAGKGLTKVSKALLY